MNPRFSNVPVDVQIEWPRAQAREAGELGLGPLVVKKSRSRSAENAAELRHYAKCFDPRPKSGAAGVIGYAWPPWGADLVGGAHGVRDAAHRAQPAR
jgi:hypothetical protein